MEYGELYEATKSAFIDAMAETKPAPRMIAIEPFDAEDDGGESVRVVGIIDEVDVMRFIVIEEDEDGAIYPIARTSIFRKSVDDPTKKARP